MKGIVCFTELQVESYSLNILEKGTIVKEIVEVDVDNQTEVIRVPQHNDLAAMEMMNDFKKVRSKFVLEKARMAVFMLGTLMSSQTLKLSRDDFNV